MLKEIKNRPRTIITTDGEVDDMNSLIRFLYYANEFDVEGIIFTSSVFHYSGNEAAGVAPYRWTGTQWLEEFYQAYDAILPNLQVHAEGYPSADDLRRVTKIGNISDKNEMAEVTQGSQWLVQKLLDDDNRPIYIQTWGGTNTTARALKTIEELYKNSPNWEKIQNKVYKKAILVVILDQDDTLRQYIQVAWPNLSIIKDGHNFWHFAYGWHEHEAQYNSHLRGKWLRENIQANHGPLLEQYALVGDGKRIEGEIDEAQFTSDAYLKEHSELERYDFIAEGDTPSFLMLLKNGLQNPEHPEYGGWGGRFVKDEDGHFINQAFDYNPISEQYQTEFSLVRWFDDLQNDFAARADWGITPNYSDANHPPQVEVIEGNQIVVRAGESIVLHAKASDPDGDDLSYHWWEYSEAGTHISCLTAKGEIAEKYVGEYKIGTYLAHQGYIASQVGLKVAEGGESAQVNLPKNAKSGDMIHVIVSVTDNGKHTLTSHQRVVLVVE